MLYLEFIDWQDYLQYLGAGKVTHLDVLDASAPGQFQFHIVGTHPSMERGVLAVCSALILVQDEPTEMDAKARAAFHKAMEKKIHASRDEMREFFRKGGIKVRAGIYSIEPPPILRRRP